MVIHQGYLLFIFMVLSLLQTTMGFILAILDVPPIQLMIYLVGLQDCHHP